jgi:Fe-S-cluster containining protein
MRLRQGLEELERKDAAIAQEVRRRARLYLENADLPEEALDRIPCPALDPATGLCDLYDWRPVTCRTFGPATHAGQGVVATCDLCFEGASQEEIASCAVEIDPEGLERALLERLENQGIKGETQVAAALI